MNSSSGNHEDHGQLYWIATQEKKEFKSQHNFYDINNNLGFHNKMKMISRRAYGFRNYENYRLRVRVLCG